MLRSRFLSFMVAGAALTLAALANADTIQLVNGDNVSGKILSVDDKAVKLQSEVFGQLTIERGKIAAIFFGDAAPPKNNANNTSPIANLQAQAKPPQPGQDVLDQLRNQGLDPATLQDIKKAFPLLTQPGAGKYFDESVAGLMSGKIGVQDIRKDAMKVIDEVNKLEKELGPQATQALRPYLSILENFVQRTEPAAPPVPPKDQPAPPKK